MWIATPDGLVRYNGYDTKLFNLSNGLSSNDIWSLTEDNTGRMWLSSITNEMGYLSNNKYHKAKFRHISQTIYPNKIMATQNGVVFVDKNSWGQGMKILCVGNGTDSLREYYFPASAVADNKTIPIAGKLLTSLIFNYHKGSLVINEGYVFDAFLDGDSVRLKYKYKIPGSLEHDLDLCGYIFGRCIITRNQSTVKDTLFALDINTGHIDTFAFNAFGLSETIKGASLATYHTDDERLFAITENYYVEFKIDSAIHFIKYDKISSLLDAQYSNKIKVLGFFNDPFWKYSTLSTTNGLYINYSTKNYFKKELKLDLNDYLFVNSLQDGLSFWWNKSNSCLLSMDSNRHVQYLKCPFMNEVKQVTEYGKDTFLVAGKAQLESGAFFWDRKKDKIIKFFSLYDSRGLLGLNVLEDKSVLCISWSDFYYSKLEDRAKPVIIDHDRYNHMSYDPIKKNTWAYNSDKIYIHSNTKDIVYSDDALAVFGVRKIEQIAIDPRFGNIFFKGAETITLYNQDNHSYQKLFGNINTKKATILLYRDLLIVAGRFGVLFSKINGIQKVSKYMLHPNIKDYNYKYVYSAQAAWNKVLLNTDKGAYWVDIPSDEDILNVHDENKTQYKFILSYKDSARSITGNDTLVIDQKNVRLQFDVINPTGNGKLKYVYQLLPGDSMWHELNSNELALPPSVLPDNYYSLSVKASDEVWNGDEVHISLYIQPYWWQRHYVVRLIWLLSILSGILVVIVSIWLTKRQVVKSNRKKNLQMELELRSIYAQINPHFIFNTLNSALLLVSKNNMDEAYTHISKFSRLLRSYIKSSRNRRISLEEEIINLKNYIELQQTRFKDKFHYEIIVDENMNLSEIMIPSLLLQPFVENAINHGLLPKKDIGNLILSFHLQQSENVLTCTVEDDGVGRKQLKLVGESRERTDESYGNLMIKDLVRIFRKYENMRIDIDYIDKTGTDTGTIVSIRIKYP